MSAEAKAAEAILFAFRGDSGGLKTASPSFIPNLMMGTPEKGCATCYFFQVYRGNLSHMDRGQDIIGPCTKWEAYTSAHKVCKTHEEGGPDVC